MTRNGSTPLSRRQKGHPMRDHDALPADLRRFLIHAALPWSPRSALRIWQDELRRGGTRQSALQRIERVARQTLRRETLAAWGAGHPELVTPCPLAPPAAKA